VQDPTAVCLVVLDGWGLAPAGPGNAVSLAHTPVFDGLWERYPHTTLTACGAAVGLPAGQMGNSEVGHLNLGAGAVVKQDLTLIDEAVKLEAFGGNEVLLAALRDAPRVHLIGLVSDGGVHSSIEHVHGLLRMAAQADVEDLVIHAFTDGRDTLPTAGSEFVGTVERWCQELGVGRVASVIGRYYAMDRDGRWERIQQAYDLLVHGIAGYTAPTGRAAVLEAYERAETDEFVSATRVGEEGTIRAGDSVIAFNFRPDRMREISSALADPSCPGIDRCGAPPITRYTTLTEYGGEHAERPVAFRPARPQVTLSRVIAAGGGLQLHVAETEKYPHVTYFFGGGKERPEEGERRELVPSPRDVPTYDHKPAMSAPAATEAFLRAWQEEDFRFAIINFANPDMVGHTGVIPAAVEAIETVDACLGRVVEAVHATGGVCIVTADHGNADHMLEPDGSPNTAHSLNPVPLVVTRDGARLDPAPGILADVAPTALTLLGMQPPPEMTGRSLLADMTELRRPLGEPS
jgi:2,3-bisphosphoglycerate-independent phosphoglycerate mutase